MRIADVEKGTVGSELGIVAGDELLSFDGNNAIDILDYNFYNESESFVMAVSHAGTVTEYEIEKEPDESLGFTFDDELSIRVCRNKCVFCFVDQLPKCGLRNTLRVKDDDYRLSFISGSYVTLTNVSDVDMERIVRLHLSPLYISIHTCNNDLRRAMLGNPKAPDIVKQLDYLHKGGIKLHAQIVYCPGINDDITDTVNVTSRYCESIAVVPVGLTKDCNKKLRAVTASDAQKVIDSVVPLQKKFLERKGTRFVFLADEFYIRAGAKIPEYEEYEDFAQYENGVGLIALFKHDFMEALSETDRGNIGNFTVATGVDAYDTVKWAVDELMQKFGGKIEVKAVRNDFFGPSVTVAGLVTGGDIYDQLKGEQLGERLVLPRCMFKEFGDVFLDNMSVNELSLKLGVEIKVIDTDGYSFVKGCTGNE